MTVREHYPVGTERGDRPEWIVDPDHDWWMWIDADGRGVPGYSQVVGRTRDGSVVHGGGAWTREYAELAHYCAYWQRYGRCGKHDHEALEADR